MNPLALIRGAKMVLYVVIGMGVGSITARVVGPPVEKAFEPLERWATERMGGPDLVRYVPGDDEDVEVRLAAVESALNEDEPA